MKVQIILLFLLAASLDAQVRYQFGDDAKWADPKFDDSAWPIAAPNKFPTPAFESDGMLWLRYRVLVPPDASPLAVRLAREDVEGIPDEVWVNGSKVGSHGNFPPHPDVRTRYTTVVFDLPPGLVTPGEIAHVAWRAWIPPVFSGVTTWSQLQPFGVEIGSRSFMRTREENAIAGARLAVSLTVLINVLVLILGVFVFALWIATRGAWVLLWFSLFVILWASSLLTSQLSFLPPETYAVFWVVWSLNSVALNVAVNEFMDAAFDVPRWAIRALEALGVLWPLLYQLPGLVVTPYSQVAAAGQLGIFLFGVWLVGQTVLTFWVLVQGPRETRALAATFAIWNVKLFASDVTKIVPLFFEWRGQRLDTDTLVLLGVIVTMCWLLLRRTWKNWLAKEELSAEFDAARAMQARMVPPAADVPGYRIESAYYPARHVGGDFFRIMAADNGALLVVVGDVSGKGLGAAMTVAALAGALDNEFSRSPGEVLEHLNRALLLRKVKDL